MEAVLASGASAIPALRAAAFRRSPPHRPAAVAAAVRGGAATSNGSASTSSGVFSVGEFMTRREKLRVVKPTTAIEEALHMLVEDGISGFPVIDDSGRLVGVVSDYDLLAVDSVSGWYSIYPLVYTCLLYLAFYYIVKSEVSITVSRNKDAEYDYAPNLILFCLLCFVASLKEHDLFKAFVYYMITDNHQLKLSLFEKKTSEFYRSRWKWRSYLFFSCGSGKRVTGANLFPDVNSSWETFFEIQNLLSKNHGKLVSDVMTPSPLALHESSNLDDAARLLLETRHHRLPVVDASGNLVGVISRGNVMKAAVERKREDQISN